MDYREVTQGHDWGERHSGEAAKVMKLQDNEKEKQSLSVHFVFMGTSPWATAIMSCAQAIHYLHCYERVPDCP